MSQTIENRIVEMQFENKQFESGVQESLSTLDKLKRALKFDDASKNLQDFGKNISKNVDFSSMESNVQKLSDRFSASGVAGMEVIRNLTNFAIEAGKTIASALDAPFRQIRQGGWKRAMNIEDAKFQLKGLDIAWESVSDDINYAVADTAYGLDEAAKACSQLSASSVRAGSDMKAALRGISGVAAMGNTGYTNIANIFTKAAGNGKVMADELNRISQYGLNARASLAGFFNDIIEGGEKTKDIPEYVKERVKSITKGTKVVEADISQMASKSKIDFATFSYAMDSAFGEHAKKANETFFGAFENIKAALSKIGAEFATPLIKGAIPVFNEIRIFLNDLRKQMGPVFDVFKRLTEIVSDKLTNKIKNFRLALLGDKGFGKPMQNLMTAFNNIKIAIVRIVAAFSTAFKEVFPKSKNLSESMKSVTEGIVKFTEKLIMSDENLIIFKNVITLVLTALQNVGDVISHILPIVGKVASVLLKIIGVVANFIGYLGSMIMQLDVVKNIMGEIHQAGGLLSYAIEKIKAAFISLYSILTDTSTITGRFFTKLIDGAKMVAYIVAAVLYVAFIKIRDVLSYFDTHDPLGSLVKGVSNLVTMMKQLPILNSIINGIKATFGAIGIVILKIVGLIRDFINNLRSGMSVAHAFGNTISTVVTGAISLIGILADKVQSLFSIFKKDKVIEEDVVMPIANASKSFVGVQKELTKTGAEVQKTASAFDKGKTAISGFVSAIVNKIKEIRAGQVLLFAFGSTITILAANLIKLTKAFTNLTSSATYAVNGLGTFFRTFGMKKTSFAEGMVAIAIAIGALTGSLWAMSKIPTKKLIEVGAVLEVLLITMGAFSLIGKNGVGPFAASMISFSGSILLLVAALYALDQVDMKNIGLKWASLAVISGIILVVAIALSKAAPQLSKGGIAILTFAGAVYILAKALEILSNADLDKIKRNWVELSAVIVAFAAFASIVSNVGIAAALGIIGFLGVLKLVTRNADMIKSNFKQIQEGFATIADALKGAVRYLYDGLKTAAEDMKENEMFASVIGVSAGTVIFTLLSMILAIGHAGKGLKKAAVGFTLVAASIAGIMYVTAKIAEMVKNMNDPSAIKTATQMLYSLLAFISILSIVATIRDKIKVEKGVNTLKDVRKLMTSLGLLLLSIGALAAMVGSLTADEFKRVEQMMIETEVVIGLIAIICTSITAAASKAGKAEVSFSTFAGVVFLLGGMLGSIAVLMFMFSQVDWERDKQQLITAGVAFGAMVISIIAILGMLALLARQASKEGAGKAIGILAVFGAVIAAFAGIVYVLSNQITSEEELIKAGLIAGGLLAFALILTSLVVGLEAFSIKLLNTEKRQDAFKKSLVGLGVMLGALGELIIGLLILKNVSAGRIWGQVTALMFALTAITALVVALEYFSKQTKFSITKKSQSNLIKTFVMIGALVVAFKSLAKTFANMADIDAGRLWGQMTAITTALIALTALAMGLIQFVKKVKAKWGDIAKAGTILAGMVGLFTALSLVFKYITNSMTDDPGDLMKKVHAVTLVLLELEVLAVGCAILGKMEKEVKSGELALLGMIGLFAALTIVFAIINALKVEGIMAKSQTIVLTILELGVLAAGCAILGGLEEEIKKGELCLLGMVGLFGVLTLVFMLIDGLKTDGILAKSQTIILTLLELEILGAICSVLGGIAPEIGLGELCLLGMVALFGVLSAVFLIIDGLKVEGIMAKSQTIILVMLELEVLGAICSVLGSLSPMIALGELCLLGMVALFGVLSAVFLIIDGLKTEGIIAKSQTIVLVMLELEVLAGLCAILGALSPAIALGELTLLGMVAMFGVLTLVFTLINDLQADGLLAKSQVIALVLLELEVLLAILGALAPLATAAMAGIPGLLGVVLALDGIAAAIWLIADYDLEKIQGTVDVFVGVLESLIGIGIGGIAAGPGLMLLAAGIAALGASCMVVSAAVTAFAGAITVLASAISTLTATGPGIQAWFTNVAAGVTTLATSIMATITGLSKSVVIAIETLIVGIIAALTKGAKMIFGAASEIGSQLVDGLKSKFGDILKIPSDIIKALAGGIKGIATSIIETGKSMGTYLVDGFRDAVGWHSPVQFILNFLSEAGSTLSNNGGDVGKIFENMGMDWGSMLSNGFGSIDLSSLGLDKVMELVNGLKSGEGDLMSEIMRLMGMMDQLTAYKSKISSSWAKDTGTMSDYEYSLRTEITKNNHAIDEQNNILKRANPNVKGGAEAIKNAKNELAKLNDKNKELTNTLNGLLGQEVKTTEATDDLNDSLSGLGDGGGKAAKGAKEAKDAVADFYDMIEGAISLFDKYEEAEEMSSDELLSNMASQITGIANWSTKIQQLATKGIDQGLLKKLADMGPQGEKYVNAFVNMTAEQLSQANKYYEQSLILPQHVTAQVYGSFAIAGFNAKEGFLNGLEPDKIREDGIAFAHSFLDGVENFLGIHSPSTKMRDEVGKNTTAGMEEGVTWPTVVHNLEVGCIRVANKVIDAFSDKLVDSDDIVKIGKNVVAGIQKGIEDQGTQSSLFDKVRSLCQKVVQTAKSPQGFWEHSPSRIFQQIGGYVVEGLAKGITDNTASATRAIGQTSEDVIDTMRETINKAQEALMDGVDDPVIKPVLDLSDIENGSRELNSMLSRNGALSASRSFGNLQNQQWNSQSALLNATMDNADIVNAVNSLKEDMISLKDAMTNIRVVLDTGTMVGAMTPMIDHQLGMRQVYAGRGI